MKKVLFALCTLLILASCQKDVEDQITTNSSCQLVRIVQGLNNSPLGDTTFAFYHNDTGRLEKVTFTVDGVTVPDPLVLQYDDRGRLIKATDLMDPGGGLESSFSYDNQGRLHEFFYRRFFDPSKIVFKYGSGNQPESATYYDFTNGQWVEGAMLQYNYTNGNVTRSDYYNNGVFKWSNFFEYDLNLPNSMGILQLIGFSSLPLGYYDEFSFFNKNLPKKKTWEDGYEYVYEYVVEDGRIVQSVGTYVYQGTPSQKDTRSFFYECK